MKFIIKLLIITLLIIPFNSIFAGRVIIVHNSSKGIKLKEIIENAENGDEIIIKPGIYKVDNIIITKSIKIIGENFPTIEGNKKDEIFTIKSNNVHVKGLKILNSGVSYLQENAAIRLEEVSGCLVEDNILDNNFFGIYVAKSFNCVIRGNKIRARNTLETNSGNGIHLWYSKAITISNNEIIGHRDGIYFEFVMHSLVENNYSAKNIRYGLHFMFSDSCAYVNNVFENNGAGVAVMYTKNVTMKKNKFINNWGAASFGVLLKDLTNCLITENLFKYNTNGLYLEGCSKITVSKNDFVRNGWGIKLMANSMNNYFFDNNFITNTLDVMTNSRNNYNCFSRNFWSEYNGYDIDNDGFGDVPYRPVKMFSVLVEKQQASLILIHSLFIELLNFAESIIPSITPIDLIDTKPRMKVFLW